MSRITVLLITILAVTTVAILATAPITSQVPPASTDASKPGDINIEDDNATEGYGPGVDSDDTTSSPNESKTDGLWQAKVGKAEFTGLNADNIGDILFEGDFITRTYIDAEGEQKITREYINIPAVEIEKNTSREIHANGSIRLIVDYGKCVVKIGLVKHETIEDQSKEIPIVLPMSWMYNNVSGVATEYLRTIDEDAFYDASPMFISPARTRRASLSAEVKGLGGSGEVLTSTSVKMLYVAHPTVGITQIYDYQGSCYVYSPLGFLASNWFLNDCQADPAVNNGDHLLGYTKGNYGIELSSSYSVNGPLAHEFTARLEGSYSGLNGKCTWTPNPDGTTVSWGPLQLTLGIDCFETFY